MDTMNRLSFSRLSLKSKCGERYRRAYVLGERDNGSVPMVAGSAIHKAVELWELGLASGSLLDIAKAELRAVPDLYELPSFSNRDAAWWFKTGLKGRVDNYLKWRDTRADWWREPVESIEVPFTVRLKGAGVELPPLRGVVDQVFYDEWGRLVICDLKTGKQKPEHFMQLQLYMLAWLKLHPKTIPDYGMAVYLDGKEPTFQATPLSLSEGDAARMLASLLHERGYPANGPFTGECQWCPFRPTCPYGLVGEVRNVVL